MTPTPAPTPTPPSFDTITYDDVLARHLAATDLTAISLAMDNRMPMALFALEDPQNIYRVVMGEDIGTIIKEASNMSKNTPNCRENGQDHRGP